MNKKIDQERFVCFDCESTGLDPEEDRIIEIGVAIFDMKSVYEQYETLIDPQREVPEESIQIHHITNAMVIGKPLIKEVLPKVLALIGNRIIVGHGITFDIALLINAAKRANIPCDLEKSKYFDTLRMARLYGESPRNSLEVLREHFNIEAEGAHRAMNDVIVNMEVFRRLARRYVTIKQLADTLSKPIPMKTMPLGKHKGRFFRDIPIEYLRWIANKDFDQDLLYSVRLELKRRKQGGLFEQSSNPFQDL